MPRRVPAARALGALAVLVAVALVAGAALPAATAGRAWASSHTVSISDTSVNEGDIGSAPATFKVRLSAPATTTVTVDYVTANGTATAGSDYTPATGTVVFGPNEHEKTVSVEVTGDLLDEDDETFTVNLSGALGATVADGQGVGTIIDDDDMPAVSVDNGTPNPVLESGASLTQVTFTVTLSSPSGRTVTVDYATANVTATAGSDYDTATGRLTFAPGEISGTVVVTVNDDAFDEDNETFTLNLTSPVNATVATGVGTSTIVDDDGPPALSIGDVTVAEGAGTATFTVTLAPASGKTVKVAYATANGTATADSDYTAANGTVQIAAGQTAATITVPILADTLDEANETFTVNLSAAENAVIADGHAVATVTDDDAGPALSIADVVDPVVEGDIGTTAVTFTVSLSAASGQPVSVAYATANGTATAPEDYAGATGTVSFAAGDTTETVTVNVVGDTFAEPAETFFVNLSGATNATIGDGQGVGTIANDDGTPAVLSVSDATVSEGNTGTANASFTVSLSPAATQPVSVSYTTADVTARAPGDYTAAGGTLVFEVGESTKVVTVGVNGDVLDEDDETFAVNLSAALNATIGDGQGIGTISDDDALPALSVADVSVTEGSSGTRTATFRVTLSPVSGRTVTVGYATGGGTATAGADYTAASGTLTFAAGQTAHDVSVAVVGDTLDEDDETFLLTLSAAVNATIADAGATATITDDDASPSLSIGDVAVVEGDSATTTATFTVTLSPASGRQVSVGYATGDGTATAGADYTAASGMLSFPAGATSATINVTVTGDVVDEADETFLVTLSGAVNATIADAQAVGTIRDDDGVPKLSIDDAQVTEGDTGTANAVFTVRLLPASGQQVTVDYATTAGTASAGGDYTTTTGTLIFAAGLTELTIPVPVVGDTVDEEDETFTVTLSGPVNATITDAEATGTILDNDAAAALAVADVTVTEGDSGTTTATLTVTLAAASGRQVTVDYATADGTAAAGSDYVAATGTLTFAPGETTATVDVGVSGDTLDEADETFLLNLSGAVNTTVADAQAVATITDDDASPSLSIGDVSVLEGDSGTTATTLTVTLSAASGRPVTVAYATADGTATAGEDYTAASGTLSFAAGQTSASVDVAVAGDTLDEANETFLVTLSGATNATLGDAGATVVILDDDGEPSVSIADARVTEPDTATANAVFTVRLLPASAQEVTVGYATTAGTASADGDYTTTTGTLTFPVGQTELTVAVPVVGDTVDEEDETFTVTLSGAVNATIGDAEAIATIVDNDAPPALSVGDVTVTEGDTGTATATFTVALSAASGRQVTAGYATADGTATAAIDYAATSGTLTFAPGQTSRTVAVTVNGDALDEENETFTLTLSGAVNATIAAADAEATATITDDDAAPALSVADVTVGEGDTTATATFTVTLSAVSGRQVTVGYATADGTATAGGDYVATTGTLNFAPGQTSRTVDVTVTGDTLDEDDETFLFNLSGEVNATVADGQAVGTIVEDDDVATLAVADVTVTEGSSGTTNVVFTVTRSGDVSKQATVVATTVDGSATSPADYAAATQTVTLAASKASTTFTVAVVADVVDEADEKFTVTLSGATGAVIGDAEATATIADDDAAPSLSIKDVSVKEGASATFTVSLSAASGRVVSVDYATVAGSAGAADFTAASGTLSIPAGKTTASITVAVRSDAEAEGNETFGVDLSKPVNATLARARAVATIVDDDQAAARTGYWLVASDGGIFAFGDARFHGSTGAITLNQPIVGSAPTPSGNGYWLVASDGGIFAFGDARFHGSTGAIKLNRPIVGMTPTPSGNGYWLVASDGGIFAFGDARFAGSTGAIRLAQPIVGMAATPSGNGYWLVASDGGIFAFGDARFAGSTGALKLARPIEGMARTPTGNGYWLVASDGGIFAFGDARFHGSTGALDLARPIEGMAPTSTGNGYWLVASDGGIFAFGDARFAGSTGAIDLNRPVVAMAAVTG